MWPSTENIQQKLSTRNYIDSKLIFETASTAEGEGQVNQTQYLAQQQWGVRVLAQAIRNKSYSNWTRFNESSSFLSPRLTSPSSDLNLLWGVFPSAARWLMALYDSVKMMGIWVTTFLLAWIQVKKKYLAGKNMQWEWSYTMCWQQTVPRSWTHSLPPAPHSHPCAGVHCNEFPFMPIPWGVMMWVRPLLWSGLKITLPKPTQPPRPADCVFALRDTQFLWHSVVHGQRQKTVSGAAFSGSKVSKWLARHRIQAMQIQPFPCCRVLEIHTTPKYQQWESLTGFAVVQTQNSGGHWS